jgi:hypothetical protein
MYRRRSLLLTLVPGLTCLIVFLLTALADDQQASQDSYYLIVFSSQTADDEVRFSHTFATFVQKSGVGAAPPGQGLEVHTLSWMPASQNISILRLRPERGVLYDLESSLTWAYSVSARVSMWGPYQIEKELYDRAIEQEARLSGGGVLYKTLDAPFRSEEVAVNCIHAVSDLDTNHGLLHVGTARGDAASYRVAEHLKRWIINPERKHVWLSEQLGLDRYPIMQRDWE